MRLTLIYLKDGVEIANYSFLFSCVLLPNFVNRLPR